MTGLGGSPSGSPADRSFLLITSHAGQKPGTAHQLRVTCAGQTSNIARSRTLPETPDTLEIVLASCFYRQNNRMTGAMPLPKRFMPPNPPPHLKILSGDQIYLDLSGVGLPVFNMKNPWDDYARQWRDPKFLAWLSSGPNICMADDHEFWNNYPKKIRLAKFASSIFKIPAREVIDEMHWGFLVYQAALNADPDHLLANPVALLDPDDLKCFEFPNPATTPQFTRGFSAFFLDTRTERAESPEGGFTKAAWLRRAIDWIEQRNGPGFLVTSQPLLGEPSKSETDLAYFKNQFFDLWHAIQASKHQLTLLTGDIHWSRAQEIASIAGAVPHYEVVSSAISRIALYDPTASLGRVRTQTKLGNTRVATAVRLADSNAAQNFAVLTFAAGARGGLKCTVQWWQFDENGAISLADVYPGWGDLFRRKMKVEFEIA
ncbi:Uncharacterized protein ToN1_48530 [Aromatoleum petrolei]|nr:Uncharacterized protein ToN1_48530 [Aromatoleum petrolei]